MATQDKDVHFKNIADAMLNCAQNNFQKGSNVSFSQDPEVKEKDLIEYESRMRVFGLQKFDGLCYLSSVSFYRTEQDLKEHKPVGTMVVFLEEEASGRFLKAMGYRDFDEEEEESVSEKLGQFSKVLAGDFQKHLSWLG